MFRNASTATSTARVTTGLAALLLAAAPAAADLVLPAAESFETGAANWFDGSSVGEVDWVAAGGADGGGYVTDTIDLPSSPPPFGLTAFRAQDEFGSSGGIFEGDWAAAGVTELRFSVRHDAPAPIGFFARMASPNNFPAAVGVFFQPILPGEWTEVVIDVTEGSPQLVLAGSTWSDVFSNIGHLQIGFDPGDLGGFPVTVDLDSVTVVPAGGVLPLLLAGGILGSRRRRR
jgi:hypothetical protein